MASITTINPLTASRVLLGNIRSIVSKKLTDYCTRRIIELGLATRSFPHEFLFYNDISAYRKSVTKLKVLLSKHILKNMPYVTFALQEFLQVQDRESLVANLYTTETTDVIDRNIDWGTYEVDVRGKSLYQIFSSSSYRRIYSQNRGDLVWLKRYCKYLNYLCRKHHVPLQLSVHTELLFDRDLLKTIPSDQRSSAKIPHSISVGVNFKFVKWTCTPALINRYLEAVKVKDSDDNLFAHAPFWATTPMINSSYDYETDFYRYSPEKLFLHMDKGVKILTTLTRKIRYGSSAFSFRDS